MLFLGSGTMHMTVERVSYLHEDEISDLMSEIKHSFRAGVEEEELEIRKAVAYVRNGAIFSYSSFTTGGSVEVTITGVVEQHVHISFLTGETKCTCGQPGWCSHRIAVIFHLYSQMNSL